MDKKLGKEMMNNENWISVRKWVVELQHATEHGFVSIYFNLKSWLKVCRVFKMAA